MNRFTDKVVLITGAASGIGEAAARRFAAEGAKLMLGDLNTQRLEQVCADIDSSAKQAAGQSLDVRELEQVEAFTAAAVERYGRLDIVFNNAGIGCFGESPDLDPATWHDVLAVDLHSVFYGIRSAVPHLRNNGGGCIVNTASISGLAADYGFAAYNAAKAAVVNYTRTAAVDHAKDNIRVNAVCPGPIKTGLTEFTESIPALVEEWKRNIPMGRLGGADEVAGVVAFLCSQDASYITGAAIPVDGGVTCTTGQANFTRIIAPLLAEMAD